MGWQPGSTLGLSPWDLTIGAIKGAMQFNTFGFADDIGTADPPIDVWNGFQIDSLNTYTFSTSADIDTLSSSNVGDTGQLIIITGLDTDWKWSSQTVLTDGQNKVTLTTPLIRVNRITNFATTDIAGVVRLYVDGAITAGVPDTLVDVRAIINGAENVSEQAIFSTPADFDTFFLNSFYNVGGGFGSGHKAEITNRFTPFGGRPILAGRFDIETDGAGWLPQKEPIPTPFAQKSDFFVRVTDVSANGTNINAGFNFELLPNPRL